MNERTFTEPFSPEFPDLLIDLVYPDGGDTPEGGSPVIVWLHGGGW